MLGSLLCMVLLLQCAVATLRRVNNDTVWSIDCADLDIIHNVPVSQVIGEWLMVQAFLPYAASGKVSSCVTTQVFTNDNNYLNVSTNIVISNQSRTSERIYETDMDANGRWNYKMDNETKSFYALLMVEASQHMLIANCLQATFEMDDPESTTLVGYALGRIEHHLRRNVSQPEELMVKVANLTNILLQDEYAGNVEFDMNSC